MCALVTGEAGASSFWRAFLPVSVSGGLEAGKGLPYHRSGRSIFLMRYKSNDLGQLPVVCVLLGVCSMERLPGLRSGVGCHQHTRWELEMQAVCVPNPTPLKSNTRPRAHPA